MTINEAIDHAKKQSECGGVCGEEHAQLALWLEELVRLRVQTGHAVANYLRNAIEEFDARQKKPNRRVGIHEVAHKMFMVDKLPDGALPIYEGRLPPLPKTTTKAKKQR